MSNAIPRHTVNIWRKPAQAISGTYPTSTIDDAIVGQYIATNYKHTKLAIGGDDNATFNILVDPLEADEVYWNYVGNRVQVFVDNPAVPVFEGYIESVAINQGAIKKVRSIANMANRVFVTYFDAGGSAQTTIVADTDSVAIYGGKEITYDANNKNAAGASFAATLASQKLANVSQPLETESPSTGGGFSCSIVVKGFYHTWDWVSFEVSTTAYPSPPAPVAANASTAANTVLARHIYGTTTTAYTYLNINMSGVAGNGWGIFYNDIDASLYQTVSPGWTRTYERRGGQTLWQFIQETTEVGDGTNRYVAGITRTDFNLGYRRAYYIPASTDIEYKTDIQGTQRLLGLNGRPVRAWTVEPNALIEIATTSVGRLFQGTNTAYLSKIQYDAETQTITWATEEDLSLDGVLNVGQYTRTTGGKFGAVPKQFY